MVTCPECDSEIDVDEYEVDKGEVLTCDNCGSNLEVISTSPLELELAPEEDEDEDEDEDLDDEDEDEDEDLEEDEDEDEEDWDE